MSERLKPCSLCGGELTFYISDATDTKFCGGSPCWEAGATCEQCGVGFDIGSFGSGISVESIEAYIIKTLNTRTPPEYKYATIDDLITATGDDAWEDVGTEEALNAAREIKEE